MTKRKVEEAHTVQVVTDWDIILVNFMLIYIIQILPWESTKPCGGFVMPRHLMSQGVDQRLQAPLGTVFLLPDDHQMFSEGEDIVNCNDQLPHGVMIISAALNTLFKQLSQELLVIK